jgi:hypothetical protein
MNEKKDEKKDEKKEPAPAPKRDRVVVRLLRRVRGITNNVGEVCGFPAALAEKLLDKSRPGGPCAELYAPPK